MNNYFGVAQKATNDYDAGIDCPKHSAPQNDTPVIWFRPILIGGIAGLGLAALVTVLIVTHDEGAEPAGPEAVNLPPKDPVFAGN